MPQPDIDRRRNDARDDRGGADQRRHAPPVPAMRAEQHRRADRDRGEERQRRLDEDQHREEGRAAVQVDMAEKERRLAGVGEGGQLGDAAGKRRDPVERVGLAAVNRPDRYQKSPERGQRARPRREQPQRLPIRPVAPPSIKQHRAARRRKKKQGGQLGADRERDRGAEQQPARRRRRARATARTRKKPPAKVAANAASVVARPECARKTGRLPSAITARAPSTGPT